MDQRGRLLPWRTGAALRTVATAALAFLSLVAALLTATPDPASAATSQSAPRRAPGPSVIKDNYIVRFVDGANAAAEAAAIRGQGALVDRVYESVFAGALVRLPAQAVEALRRNPRVAAVEADQVVTADGVQPYPAWGLDRSDQRYQAPSSAYNYPNTGAGVTAYVLDTGINAAHVDFGGRVRSGYTVFEDGTGTTDCSGHGTHVAGTVGGSTYGMAKATSLVAVRVLGCDGKGSTSGIIAGLDWVAADHTQGRPAVVNMSLGGSASPSLDFAARAVITDGVTVVTSAGNLAIDACSQSPASLPEAITVGATDALDIRAPFSNWGRCVDLFAPGVGITSDSYSSTTGTRVMSGTSMAAPHVAGAVAVLLASQPSLTPAAVASAMASGATPGIVGDAGTGSPNRLLYSPFDLAGRPANDNLSAASPIPLTGAGPLLANNVGASREAGEPYHAGVDGGGSLWWTFTPTGPGTVTLSTQGSTFDTLLGVYTGSSVSALRQVAANDDASPGDIWSQVSIPVSAGVPHRVAVDGDSGRSGSVTLGFTWAPSVTPASVGGSPTGVIAVPGDSSATLSWTAPASDGGSAVTGYAVTPYVGTEPGTPQTFASPVTGQRIGGLTNGTTYTFTVAAINAAGTGPESEGSNPVAPVAVEPGTFNPLSPARILDTRAGNGAPRAKVGPGQTLGLQVTGRGGVPADGVSAVVMNVTVAEPSAASFLTAWPAGEPKPDVSNLNYVAGQTVPNLVVVKVGAGGKVSLNNAMGSTQVIADVVGWYSDGSDTSGARFRAVSPARILDTRAGNGAPRAKVGPGQTLGLQVTGRGGVPADGVSAVVMNVTVAEPSAASFLTAWPAGEARPDVSNLNYVAGQTVPNLVVVKVGAGGKVSLNNAMGSTQVIADVVGWYSDGSDTSGARFRAVSPARILDTRAGNGAPRAKLGPGQKLDLAVTGRGGVPTSGVSAVVMNVTVAEPSAASFLTAWPAGEARPDVSNLNYVAGQTVPNLVVVKVGAGGKVSLNNASGSTQVIADVVGWYNAE